MIRMNTESIQNLYDRIDNIIFNLIVDLIVVSPPRAV